MDRHELLWNGMVWNRKKCPANKPGNIISKIFACGAKKFIERVCRIDLGLVDVFAIFSILKQSKNNEQVFLDFEGSTDHIIFQIFF